MKGRGLRRDAEAESRAPGAAFLLGKILNAFLLDHVDVDIELLNRLNSVLVDGTRAFGDPGSPQSMSREAQKRGAPAYRFVHNASRFAPAKTSGGSPAST